MKSYVYFLAVVLMLVMVPSAYAVFSITEDWAVDYTASQIYACTYNPTTDHVLLAATDTIPIYNASNGTATGSSLEMPSVFTGPIFAITCAEDGAIFAYELYSDIFYWADESATPVALTFTGVARMGTLRCLRAYGSGNDTRIYITGGADNNKIQMITTDGTNWIVEDLVAAPAAKSGVFAVPPAFTTVYGLQPWGSDYDPGVSQGWPMRFDYTGSAFEINTGFMPEDPAPDPPPPDPANHTSYCVGGDYIPATDGQPAFVYIFYYNLGLFWALNADTGARIAGLDYAIPGFNSYAMNVQADTTNKKIYYASRRSATQGGAGIAEGVFGCLSYGEVAPTPWEAAVQMDWQIYE